MSVTRPTRRPALLGLLLLLACLAGQLLQAGAASAASESRADAVRQLGVVRVSIDRTLELIKSDRAEEAFAEAKEGYLSHFEYVEIPLRVADAALTSDAETKFAEIRGLISGKASTDEVRANIVELRSLIDSAERRLTDTGIGAPAVVFGQSFVIIFREGLEAVLLVSVLLGYLEAARAGRFLRPILTGMGAAVVAIFGTFLLLRGVLAALPYGREVLEAVTALFAVVLLFYVSFWLVSRMEHTRWLEFVRGRIWTAVSTGSATALMLVGFTALYREGVETALFYEALLSFGPGLGWYVTAGLGAGVAALAVVAWLIFKLGRRIPIPVFLTGAVLILTATSVTFLGNAVRSLQEADMVPLHRWDGWPDAPIFIAQSLGYWPSRETILAQAALLAVYVAGAAFVLVTRRRRKAAARAVPPLAPARVPPLPAPAREAAVAAADGHG